jgi:hypothetical protein
MPDTPWKAAERRIAAILGGRRVPVSGRSRGDAPDIQHDWLSVECKNRATLPRWMLDAIPAEPGNCALIGLRPVVWASGAAG